jgi:hypothetical protein
MPTNTAEGGTNGATVTAANSGGLSCTAFDTVTISQVDSALIYDNAHAVHGSLAYKFTVGPTAAQVFVQWLAAVNPTATNRILLKFAAYFTANPAANNYLVHVATAGGAQVCGIKVNTSGQLILVNQAGSTVATMTTAIPLNAWFQCRADFALDGTGVNIFMQLWRYDTLDSDQPNDYVSGTGAVAQPFNRVRFGQGGTAVANLGPWWMDDLEVSLPDGQISSPDTFLPGASLLALLDDDTAAESPLGYLYVPWPEMPVTSASVDTTLAGVTAALVFTAQTGTVSTTLPGATAGVALAAQPGAVSVTINGPTAAIVLAAPTGTVSVGAPGATATVVLTAQVGSVSTGANVTITGTTTGIIFTANPGTVSVTLPGATATVVLAAAPGAVAVTLPGATAHVVLASSAGTVSVGLPGATTGITFLARVGAVSVTLPGVTATVVFNAPAGSLGIGSNVTIAGTTTGIVFTARTGLVGVGLPGATGHIVLAAVAGSVDNGLIVVPVTVTGTDRATATVTSSDTGSGVTGTDRASASVSSTDRSSATVAGTDRPTSTVS